MSTHFLKTTIRRAWLLGGLALGLSQVGCAHPVVMEPSVVVSSQIGRASVYAQMDMPSPVIYGQPRVIYAPPPLRVIYAPPMYRPAPGWGHGHDRHEGGYGQRWEEHRGHGGRNEWRR